VARRHPQSGDPPLLGRLTEDLFPADNSARYQGGAARWYDAVYAWKTDDLAFYQAQAERWAGPGGAILELACGTGRVTLALARAGFRVTALDSAAEMLEALTAKLDREPEEVRRQVDVQASDMRSFELERLFRFICLPFNSMLLLVRPQERQAMLDRVREHLAPSGAFAFEIFTPDPARLVAHEGWDIDVDVEADDPGGEGKVHVLRQNRRTFDYAAQVTHLEFRTRVSRGEIELASWEDGFDIAYVFPRELELMLERQGFRITDRFGGPLGEPYAPAPGNIQPQFVVAQLVP
jgi:SAM-dependent methyltransferase